MLWVIIRWIDDGVREERKKELRKRTRKKSKY